MLYAGQADSLIWWLIAPFFMAWASAPFAGFALEKPTHILYLAALLVGGSVGVFSGWVVQELARLLPVFSESHLSGLQDVLVSGPLAPRLVLLFAGLLAFMLWR